MKTFVKAASAAISILAAFVLAVAGPAEAAAREGIGRKEALQDGECVLWAAIMDDDPTMGVTPGDESEGATKKKDAIKIKSGDVRVGKAVYDGGKGATASVTVKHDGTTLTWSADYTLEWKNNKEAGKGKVIVKGRKKYRGRVEKTFVIEKANQELKVQPGSKSFQASKLMKDGGFFEISIKGAEGEVSLKSASKYVTLSKEKVNAKSGGKIKVKITVRKGTPKGSYKITVRAKETKNYKASKEKSIKINVK